MNKQYFKQLDSLRLICAIFVVLHHTLYRFAPDCWIQKNISLGNSSVSLFFVLSGFVLFYNYYQNFNFRKYLISSLTRIYPLYWISILVFFIMVGASHFWMGVPTTSETISVILGIQAFIPYPHFYFGITAIGWFVSAEIFLRLIFPYLLDICNEHKTNSNIKLVLLSIISYAILALISLLILNLNDNNANTYLSKNEITTSAFLWFNPIAHIFQFSIGMMLGKYVIKHQQNWDNLIKNKLFRFNSILLLFSLFLLFCTQLPFRNINTHYAVLNDIYHYTYLHILTSIASVFVILSLLINKGYLCEIFNITLLTDLGKLSFCIFLFHPIISSVLFSNISYNNFTNETQILIYWICLLIVSLTMYIFIEKRLKNLAQLFLQYIGR